MDNSQPGPSNVHIPLLMKEDVDSDKEAIPFADSPESPELKESKHYSELSAAHDGIILLITSDAEGQKSPNGSFKQHPLSDVYLLPFAQDHSDSSSHRRHSLQDRTGKKHHYSPERKVSCPDAELQLRCERRKSSTSLSPRSEQNIALVGHNKDRLTPTSFCSNNGIPSRRSSNCDLSHSRRSSTCSMGHNRRSSSCSVSRRSSNCSVSHSRRSSNCSGGHSRRSSNCSRRSSHCDSDEECQHQHHHHHHRHHRGSRTSIEHTDFPHHKHQRSPSTASAMSFQQREDYRRASKLSIPIQKTASEEELEAGGIPLRHRRIIIMIIGSVSVFILVMSVVLIAVSLTLSPTIDDLVRKENEELYGSMSSGTTTGAPVPNGSSIVGNDTIATNGQPG